MFLFTRWGIYQENVSGYLTAKRILGGLKAYLRATDHTCSNIISRDIIFVVYILYNVVQIDNLKICVGPLNRNRESNSFVFILASNLTPSWFEAFVLRAHKMTHAITIRLVTYHTLGLCI
jgi:hypothetical protein